MFFGVRPYISSSNKCTLNVDEIEPLGGHIVIVATFIKEKMQYPNFNKYVIALNTVTFRFKLKIEFKVDITPVNSFPR
jgi:hypothetical protein